MTISSLVKYSKTIREY